MNQQNKGAAIIPKWERMQEIAKGFNREGIHSSYFAAEYTQILSDFNHAKEVSTTCQKRLNALDFINEQQDFINSEMKIVPKLLDSLLKMTQLAISGREMISKVHPEIDLAINKALEIIKIAEGK